MKLFWSKRFIRDFKRLIRQNPQIRYSVEKTLQLLEENYTEPSLRTHKLKGELENSWSCSIDYKNRLIFEFVNDPNNNDLAINLLTLGSHDDVY